MKRLSKSLLFMVMLAGVALLFAGCVKNGPKDTQVPSQQQIQNNPDYQLGSKIIFGGNGNTSAQYMGTGWSEAEPDFTWSDGPSAVLFFTVHNVQKDLTLKAKGTALLVPGQLEKQIVVINANDQKIGELTWDLSNNGTEKIIVIPSSVMKDDQLQIRLDFPNATSPKDLGINQDTRKLGVALNTIVIE